MPSADSRPEQGLGTIRTAAALILAPIWFICGMALYWYGDHLLGIVVAAIGIILTGTAVRFYRAMQRRDTVRDERENSIQHHAGYNGFWMMLFIPSILFLGGMFTPSTIIPHITYVTISQYLWPISFSVGITTYLYSIFYYRAYGQ